MKTILAILWAIFFIATGGYIGNFCGKLYEEHGFFIAVCTLLTLTLAWGVMYLIGLWAMIVYIP